MVYYLLKTLDLKTLNNVNKRLTSSNGEQSKRHKTHHLAPKPDVCKLSV